MSKPIKLRLGCGWRDFGPDWIHIDGGDYDHLAYKDIIRLPFEDNSVDLIYASHVLEYFDRQQAEDVLSKWFSKLTPGGKIRLAVPDFEQLSWLYTKKIVPLDKLVGPLYGRMKMGDSWIYHRTVYDFNSLAELLKKVGFTAVIRYNWRETEHANYDDHSQAYIPHMDKQAGVLISLNVEAIKP